MNLDLSYLKQYDSIGVACSGGSDSMALCHLLLEQQISFSILHCNFQLRGKESEFDEDFVVSFSKQYNLPLYVKRFHTLSLSKKNKTSIEEEARNLRYNFFQEISSQVNLNLILTAHHADDNVETILLKLNSRSSIQGLKGIPFYRNPNIHRPLLTLSKSDINNYISTKKINYREDSSNQKIKYIRNKIRHQVIPTIKEINPSYTQSFLHFSNLMHQAEAMIDYISKSIICQWKEKNDVDISEYKGESFLSLLIHRLFREITINHTQVQDIVNALSSKEAKIFILNHETTLEIKNYQIKKVRLNSNSFAPIRFHNLDEFKNTKHLKVCIDNQPHFSDGLTLDTNLIKFPIILRKPLSGDKIKKKGMQGKSKKLSDIFQEHKWSINQKQNALLLEDANQRVIFILGLFPSEDVMTSSQTTSFLSILPNE